MSQDWGMSKSWDKRIEYPFAKIIVGVLIGQIFVLDPVFIHK